METRHATNPIFNDNPLKLGIFAQNSAITQMTTVAERAAPGWAQSRTLIDQVNRMGLEAVVSYVGWRGPIAGDARHLSNKEFESFTWIAALSDHAAMIATFHAQLNRPAFIAKAAATIDQITGGRAGLNIVAGSSKIVFGQFGIDIEDPKTRYEHAAEFMEILNKFWTEEEEFDFDGKFDQIIAGVSLPKPIQRPGPAIMNAGNSETGRNFAAKYSDISFTHFQADEESWAPHIAAYRANGRDNYGRDLQVWTHGYVVIGETDEDALDYLNNYAETHADQPWIDAWIDQLSEGAAKIRPEQLVHMTRNWAAGGGFPLVGAPATIADTLARLSNAGLDGILLTAVVPEAMLDRFAREVTPLLEQAGLRKPFAGKG